MLRRCYGCPAVRHNCTFLPDARIFQGGAGGSQVSKRKRESQHNVDSESLAVALTSFLETWTDRQTRGQSQETNGKGSKGEAKRQKPNPGQSPAQDKQKQNQEGQDKTLAKKLIKILKQCMNTGKSEVEVVKAIRQELPGQPNSSRTPEPQRRAPADPPKPNKATSSGKGKGVPPNSRFASPASGLKSEEWSTCRFPQVETTR